MDAAAARLRRILGFLPLIADDTTHAIDDVLARTGIDRETLFGDLVALTERYDNPGSFTEGVQVVLDEDTVSLFAPRFRRPPRITPSELTALELGLSVLRRERPPDEWPVIDRAVGRLRDALAGLPVPDEHDGLYAADVPAAATPQVLEVLRRAVRTRRKVSLTYQGSADAEPAERIVCPYGFVFASGMWYVVAGCERAGGERVFRADRMMHAELTDATFTVPPAFSLNAFARRHRAFDDGRVRATMTVRYSPAIARWIAEREGREVDGDGALVMEHPLADRAWAVRHVLQYGAEAEVLEPADLRLELKQLLGRIAAG